MLNEYIIKAKESYPITVIIAALLKASAATAGGRRRDSHASGIPSPLFLAAAPTYFARHATMPSRRASIVAASAYIFAARTWTLASKLARQFQRRQGLPLVIRTARAQATHDRHRSSSPTLYTFQYVCPKYHKLPADADFRMRAKVSHITNGLHSYRARPRYARSGRLMTLVYGNIDRPMPVSTIRCHRNMGFIRDIPRPPSTRPNCPHTSI